MSGSSSSEDEFDFNGAFRELSGGDVTGGSSGGEKNDENYFFGFSPPCSVGVFGPTMGGKSVYVQSVIMRRKTLFDRPVSKIYYFFDTWTRNMDELHKEIPRNEIEFIKGDISSDFIKEEIGLPPASGQRKREAFPLIIVDDFDADKMSSDHSLIYRVFVHHYDLCEY